eukprot:jgi/Chlat1/402/Chrsp10S00054
MELAAEHGEERQAAALDAKDASRLSKRKRADNGDTSEADEPHDDGKEDAAADDDGGEKPREVMSRTEHAKLAAAARWKKHKEVKEATGKSGQEGGETLQIRTRSEAKIGPSEANTPVKVKKKPGPKPKGVVVESSKTLTAEGKVRKKPGPKPKPKVVAEENGEGHAVTPPVKVHKKPGPKPKPKPSVEVVKVKGKPGRKPKAAVAAVDDKSGAWKSTAPVKIKKKPGRKPKAAAQLTEKEDASAQLSKKQKSLDMEGVEEESVRKKPGPKPKAKPVEVERKKPGRKPKLKLAESASPQTKSVTTSKSAGSKETEAASPQSKSPTERKKPGRKPKSQVEKQEQAANVSAKKMAIALSTARARAAKAAKAAKRAETLAQQQAVKPAMQLPKLAATEPTSAAQELKHGDQEPMTVDEPAGGVEGQPDTGTAESQAPAMHAGIPSQTAAGGAEQPNLEHQEPEDEPAVKASAETAAAETEKAPELAEPHQPLVVTATPASQTKPSDVTQVEAPAAKLVETSKPSEKRVASISAPAKANTTTTTTVQTQPPVAVPTLASVLLQFPKRKGPGRPTNAEIAARKAALAAAAAAAGVPLPLPSPPRVKPPPAAAEVRDRSERRKIKRPEAADMIMEPMKVDRETRFKEKKLLREMRKDKEKGKLKRKEKMKEKMKLSFKGRDEKAKDKDVEDKDNESNKEEGAYDEQDGERRTSSMFPFKKKETVIILGNRRTPSKFNNRRAVVTDVGLNGWYEVRTIDTSEVLRVQYMALKSASKMEKLRAKLKEKKSERDLTLGAQAAGEVSTPKSPKTGASAHAAVPEMRPASGAALADQSTAVPSITEAAAVAAPSTAATALEEVMEKRRQEVLQLIVQEALEVEELIPWSHVRKIWRTRRNSWRRNMKHASSLQELGKLNSRPQLKELRAALLVDPTDARNGLTMGDAWEQHLAAITEAEDAEAFVALWADLSDGIKQWLALTPVRADGELHLGVLLASNDNINNIDSDGMESLTLADDQPAVQEGGVATDQANTTNNKPTQTKTVRYFASAAAAIVAAATAAAEAVATGKAVELPLESLLSGSADELKAVREALEHEREQVAQQLKLLEEQVMNTLTNPRPLSFMDKTRTEAAMNMITDTGAATVRTTDAAELPM